MKRVSQRLNDVKDKLAEWFANREYWISTGCWFGLLTLMGMVGLGVADWYDGFSLSPWGAIGLGLPVLLVAMVCTLAMPITFDEDEDEGDICDDAWIEWADAMKEWKQVMACWDDVVEAGAEKPLPPPPPPVEPDYDVGPELDIPGPHTTIYTTVFTLAQPSEGADLSQCDACPHCLQPVVIQAAVDASV